MKAQFAALIAVFAVSSAAQAQFPASRPATSFPLGDPLIADGAQTETDILCESDIVVLGKIESISGITPGRLHFVIQANQQFTHDGGHVPSDKKFRAYFEHFDWGTERYVFDNHFPSVRTADEAQTLLGKTFVFGLFTYLPLKVRGRPFIQAENDPQLERRASAWPLAKAPWVLRTWTPSKCHHL